MQAACNKPTHLCTSSYSTRIGLKKTIGTSISPMTARAIIVSTLASLALVLPTSLSFSMSSADVSSPSQPKTVIIAGAGVIGTSTAYYLAKNFNVKSILVDVTGQIAPAASGKAGGFLALDWNDHTPPLGRLARRSFALHEELAKGFGYEKIMYRRLTCASISVDPTKSLKKPGGKKLAGVDWAQDDSSDDPVLGMQSLGDEETIAQVHPRMLCDSLFEDAKKTADCELVKGEVDFPLYDDDDQDKLVGVKLKDGSEVRGDAVLYACGPWSGPWTKGVMLGVKYHSVHIPTPRVLDQAVFFSGCGDPEVYPRPDKTAYCCGFPDGAIKVSERPGEEEVRQEKVDEIVHAVRSASGKAGVLSADPCLTQSCYLPSTPDGLPMMGKVSDQKGCYVAAGHSCWGILLGPGTGETMANVIATGKSTEYVDIRWFDPNRFD